MLRNSLFHCLFALIVVGTVPTQLAVAAESSQGVSDAIEYFDRGEFDNAIGVLEQVLSEEPDNGTAAYELALAHDAKGDLESCAKTAKRYLRRLKKEPSQRGILPQLSMLQASCYSKAGKARKALKVFRAALKQGPDDYGLNFNIAITLLNEGEELEAITHLQKAIMADARHASPYYVIGFAYQDLGRSVESLFAYLTFLQREFDTSRAVSVAQAALEVAYSYVKLDAAGEKTTIILGSGEDAPDIPTLALTLSISAAISAPDGKIKEPIAESISDFLSQFISIAAEMDIEADPDSFLTSHLLPDVLGLHEAEVTMAFSYFVLNTAGVVGADEWLDSHKKETDELFDYFEFLAYKGTAQK